MQRERATEVAIVVSGETVIATVAAGTRTPPTPKPAMVPRPTAVFGVSGVTQARAPPNAAGKILANESRKVDWHPYS